MTGVDYKPTIFLFNDTQVLEESFLEDVNNILSSGEVPNLYKPDEFEEVCDYHVERPLIFLCIFCVSSFFTERLFYNVKHTNLLLTGTKRYFCSR